MSRRVARAQIKCVAPEAFRVGAVQLCVGVDISGNVEQACTQIRAAAARGANVICLPELFSSHYFCQSEDHAKFELAESIPGPTSQRLATLAKELGVVIVASLFERRAAGIYHNSVAVLDADGSLAGLYRKMHIPDDPLYHEKFYFAPGDLGFRGIDTRFARVGPLVCWDQWFPEAARLTALDGATVLVYPTAIGWHPAEKSEFGAAQLDAWRTMQRAHAIANGVYVVAINRVGHEGPETGGIEFWGHSFVCDPFGRVLAQASDCAPDVLVVDCDLGELESIRRHWPFLRDRRVDAYQPLSQRFRR